MADIGRHPNPTPEPPGPPTPRPPGTVGGSSGIINQGHKQQIDESIGKLKEAQKEIAMAERAGLTTGPEGQKLSDAKSQVDNMLNKLQAIKNVYFPNG